MKRTKGRKHSTGGRAGAPRANERGRDELQPHGGKKFTRVTEAEADERSRKAESRLQTAEPHATEPRHRTTEPPRRAAALQHYATGPRLHPAESRHGAVGPQLRTSESQLYGVAPVLEALRAGTRSFERITVAEGAHEHRLHELFELARRAGVPVRRAPRAELERAAAGANHQGVVATVAAARYLPTEELLGALAARVGTDEPPLALVLDGVEDPRNLGAIIRTAECAGAHGVFIPERRAAGLTETVAKTAAGALEYVSVARAANVARLAEELKERGVWTVGAAAGAPVSYTEWDWTGPCALVLGGEGEGLRRLVRERCDVLVSIPLLGKVESLNVSVAAGVVLYEAVRQRTAARRAAYKESPVEDARARQEGAPAGRDADGEEGGS